MAMKPGQYNGLFKAPLNQISAYWLGFIAADGSIGRYPSPVFSFGLKIDDAPCVRQLASDVGFPDRVVERAKHATASLRLSCKELVLDLESHGLVPRKARALDGSIIPRKHVRDFIRGLFDGDGTVGLAKPTSRDAMKPVFGIYGNPPLMKSIASVLRRCGDIGEWIRPSTGVMQIQTGNRTTIKNLYGELYGHMPQRFLDRKRISFLEAINYRSAEHNIIRDENGRRLEYIHCFRCGRGAWKRSDQIRRHKRNFCSRKCAGVCLAEERSFYAY